MSTADFRGFFARPELMLGGVHGNDEAKVYAELCAAVEEMIEVIQADGKELPHNSCHKKLFVKTLNRALTVPHAG